MNLWFPDDATADPDVADRDVKSQITPVERPARGIQHGDEVL
jgi:hypothetical protein